MLGIKGKERKMAAGGLGNAWRQDQRSGRNTSYVAIRGYLYLAVTGGCLELVQLQASGFQSDCLLGAMIEHCKAVQAASAMLGRPLSPVELFCPLGAGTE